MIYYLPPFRFPWDWYVYLEIMFFSICHLTKKHLPTSLWLVCVLFFHLPDRQLHSHHTEGKKPSFLKVTSFYCSTLSPFLNHPSVQLFKQSPIQQLQRFFFIFLRNKNRNIMLAAPKTNHAYGDFG